MYYHDVSGRYKKNNFMNFKQQAFSFFAKLNFLISSYQIEKYTLDEHKNCIVIGHGNKLMITACQDITRASHMNPRLVENIYIIKLSAMHSNYISIQQTYLNEHNSCQLFCGIQFSQVQLTKPNRFATKSTDVVKIQNKQFVDEFFVLVPYIQNASYPKMPFFDMGASMLRNGCFDFLFS